MLTFFWGAFVFISASTRRAPWYLSPALAAIGYGWTFNRGFFNYYLSLGVAFFAHSRFFLPAQRLEKRLLVLAFVPLILANPLGVAWLVAACVYIALAEVLPKSLHLFLINSRGNRRSGLTPPAYI